jgi:hypothetical protein
MPSNESGNAKKLPKFKAELAGTKFVAGKGQLPRFEVTYAEFFTGIIRRASGDVKPSPDLKKNVFGHNVVLFFSSVRKQDVGEDWLSRVTNLEELVNEHYGKDLAKPDSSSQVTRGPSDTLATTALEGSTVQGELKGDVPEISINTTGTSQADTGSA